MKRVLLLLLVLGSMSLSAQNSQKRYRHHEFSSSFSVGSNPADKTVQDVTTQYIDTYQMEVARVVAYSILPHLTAIHGTASQTTSAVCIPA